jgi:hypothetical protein
MLIRTKASVAWIRATIAKTAHVPSRRRTRSVVSGPVSRFMRAFRSPSKNFSMGRMSSSRNTVWGQA